MELKLIFTTIVYTGNDNNLNKMNSIIIDFCKFNKVDVIDFKNSFIDSPHLFYDKLHFLPNGSDFYARTIFDAIRNKLIDSNLEFIENHDLNDGLILKKIIIWSKFFEVENNDFIKVLVDAEFGADSNAKQALMAVDYDIEPITSNLIKSANDEIGFFSYITGHKNKRMEVLLHIDIPSNCSRVRIGLRTWSSQKVKINKSSIVIVKA